MWIWARDARFTGFIAISFSTAFLLIILSLTGIKINVFVCGVIYYLIFLNFVVCVLYLKAVSKIVNPKYTVDLILRTRDSGKNNNTLISDVESRLFAVYEIIRKGIENRDIYLVIKCLEMIANNFDKYRIFKKKNEEYEFKNVEMLFNLITKLERHYRKKCLHEPLFIEGLEAFNEVKDKCWRTLWE